MAEGGQELGEGCFFLFTPFFFFFPPHPYIPGPRYSVHKDRRPRSRFCILARTSCTPLSLRLSIADWYIYLPPRILVPPLSRNLGKALPEPSRASHLWQRIRVLILWPGALAADFRTLSPKAEAGAPTPGSVTHASLAGKEFRDEGDKTVKGRQS